MNLDLSMTFRSLFCSVVFASLTSIHPSIGMSLQTPAPTAAPKPAGQTDQTDSKSVTAEWNQWRGPKRTGLISAAAWPNSVSSEHLKQIWAVKLGPSYSGPIVVGNQVFTTETKDKKFEVVKAFDRQTGKELWSTQWEGSMTVPFFANSNGSWIRATPAFDDGRLYVAGIKDVLVCLNATTGEENWKVDFPAQFKSEVPTFGFVCSPLIDGEHLYIQAGGAFCKLNKLTGEVLWRGLEDGGGMNGSAFSSPVIETVAGQRQAIVQTRTNLCGVDLATGKTLWSQEIPTFRGMNILTPIIYGDNIFASSYGGSTQLINVGKTNDQFSLTQKWNLPAQGYMNSPVVIAGHAYMHLKNQRLACYDLASGVEKWRSKPMGKYASMIGNGDQILALDESGELLLFRANPESFELLSSIKVGDDSWAHLAIRGNQLFVRNLNELIAFEWN